jgi:hypothetical protein
VDGPYWQEYQFHALTENPLTRLWPVVVVVHPRLVS